MLNPSDEIKAKLDIVEVIRHYTPVKAAGANFMARCPFHNEKTPSLSISPTKQVWHCFGCARGGDLFSFVMEMENLSFVEALRLLAPRAGVTLRAESGANASLRNRLLDIMEQVTGFYHRLLMTEQTGAIARQYAKERGLTEETVKEWQIGFAPLDWNDAIDFLRSRKHSETDIVAAGLGIRKEGTNRIYNRFRGRLMFPVCEINGNTVGFSGRILPQLADESSQGKYINSPQTPLYDKSRILFGLDKAKQAIRETKTVVAVEGQMDCVSAHQAGFKNVIATSGTALTDEQISLLKRFTNSVSFALDMDSAGKAALDRASEAALRGEMETKVIILPAGKDPDECIRKDPEGWLKAVKEAKPVMEYYFEETLSSLDLSSPTGRRRGAELLLPRLARVANSVEQSYWLKILAEKLDTPENVLLQDLKKESLKDNNSGGYINKILDKAEVSLESKTEKSREEILSENLLCYLLAFPFFIRSIDSRLSIEQLVGEVNQALYRLLIIYYNKNSAKGVHADTAEALVYPEFRVWLSEQTQADEKVVKSLDRLALITEKDYADSETSKVEQALAEIITHLRRAYLSRRLKLVTRLITEVQSKKTEDDEVSSSDRLRELLNEFKNLTEELRQLPN